MKLRRLFFPGNEWYARRPGSSSVNLTRPRLGTVISPVVLVLFAVLFAVTADGHWIRTVWIVVGLAALALASMRIWRRRRPGEEMLFADDVRLVYAHTPSGRLGSTPAFLVAADPSADERVRLVVGWDDVLATAATPTGAPWWAWRRPRVHVDLFVPSADPTDGLPADDIRVIAVDVDPPAVDLPRTRLRFTVPRFSQQAALNLLRWYSPHLLVDPVTGGSALFLEPDGNPWPDAPPATPGTRQVPIPPGPILGLPAVSIPVTEWAPPEPAAVGDGRPDFEAVYPSAELAGRGPDGTQPAAGGPVPLRARPPHVAVFGHLGRITGAGRAWRIGWLVLRLVMSSALLLLFVILGIVALTSSEVPGSVIVVSAVFSLWFGFGVWRYLWRLLRLRDAAASFVALTPGGVRVVDADSYASIPWRVIREATLHIEGRRSWLCLGVDADAPADISWAVLRAPASAQVRPGRTVLWLRLPKDQADPDRLGSGLWVGGHVPFNPIAWPAPVSG
jgi:hypothetical protein